MVSLSKMTKLVMTRGPVGIPYILPYTNNYSSFCVTSVLYNIESDSFIERNEHENKLILDEFSVMSTRYNFITIC